MSDSVSVAAVHKPQVGAKILEVTPSSFSFPMTSASSRQSSEEKLPFRQLMKHAPGQVQFVEGIELSSEIELHPMQSNVTVDEKKEADDLQHKRASFVWRDHLQEKPFHRSDEQATVVSYGATRPCCLNPKHLPCC
jgi:hypothetical protein